MYRSFVVAIAVASLVTFASCTEQKTPSTMEGTTSTAAVQDTGSDTTGTVNTETEDIVVPRVEATNTETTTDTTTTSAVAGTVVTPKKDISFTIQGAIYTEAQILEAVSCLREQGSNYESLAAGFEMQLSIADEAPEVYEKVLQAIGEAILFYQGSANIKCL